MPYIYDMEEIEWPEDGEDLPPPKPEQFIYLSSPDYGGSPEPVKFSYTPYIEPQEPQPSLFERFFGSSKPQSYPAPEERTQKLWDIAIPALRDIGISKLYCRYDGGNDEGFAWLDRAELMRGGHLDRDTLLNRLSQVGLPARLQNAGLMDKELGRSRRQFSDMLNYWLCNEWATMLLGRGFGTGNYVMYGAFIVDLENCTIMDDPKADPVTENVTLGGQGS